MQKIPPNIPIYFTNETSRNSTFKFTCQDQIYNPKVFLHPTSPLLCADDRPIVEWKMLDRAHTSCNATFARY